MDWTAAYAAAGRFLDELCNAAGVDRSTLDGQTLEVTLVDRESETSVLRLDMSMTASPGDQVDDTELSRLEQASGMKADEKK
jgi:hypothetical protein